MRIAAALVFICLLLPAEAQERSLEARRGLGLDLATEVMKNQINAYSVSRFYVAPSYLIRRKANVYYKIGVFTELAWIKTKNTDREYRDSEWENGLSFGYQRSWFLADRWLIQCTPALSGGLNNSKSSTLYIQQKRTFETSATYYFGKIEMPLGIGYGLTPNLFLTANINLLTLKYSKGSQAGLDSTLPVDRFVFDAPDLGRLSFSLNYYFGK